MEAGKCANHPRERQLSIVGLFTCEAQSLALIHSPPPTLNLPSLPQESVSSSLMSLYSHLGLRLRPLSCRRVEPPRCCSVKRSGLGLRKYAALKGATALSSRAPRSPCPRGSRTPSRGRPTSPWFHPAPPLRCALFQIDWALIPQRLTCPGFILYALNRLLIEKRAQGQ